MISRYDYSRFMGLYAAAIVALQPQGRTQALHKVTFKDVLNSFNQGVNVSSSEFKTQTRYKHQIIILSGEILHTLTQQYIQVIRPLVFQSRMSSGYSGWLRGNTINILFNILKS